MQFTKDASDQGQSYLNDQGARGSDSNQSKLKIKIIYFIYNFN
jgi:hypothetical protein